MTMTTRQSTTNTCQYMRLHSITRTEACTVEYITRRQTCVTTAPSAAWQVVVCEGTLSHPDSVRRRWPDSTLRPQRRLIQQNNYIFYGELYCAHCMRLIHSISIGVRFGLHTFDARPCWQRQRNNLTLNTIHTYTCKYMPITRNANVLIPNSTIEDLFFVED